jgi:hypothetical protein
MARTLGAVGLMKRGFEQEFMRYCDQHGFEPGYECARLLHQAAKNNDVREFVQLSVVSAKYIAAPGDTGEDEGQLPLVIERHRATNAA